MESDIDKDSAICSLDLNSVKSKTTHVATKTLQDFPFSDLCLMYINYLKSPSSDRVYPYFIKHKHDKQNFRKRCVFFKYDATRDRLFRQFVTPLGEVKYVPVIPEEKEQWRQISIYHEGTGNTLESKSLSGHFGRDKTVALMTSKMFFPNMKQKIASFVNTCVSCQRLKSGSKFEKGGDKLKTNSSSIHGK